MDFEKIIAVNTERMAVEQESEDFEQIYSEKILDLLAEVVAQVATENSGATAPAEGDE